MAPSSRLPRSYDRTVVGTSPFGFTKGGRVSLSWRPWLPGDWNSSVLAHPAAPLALTAAASDAHGR